MCSYSCNYRPRPALPLAFHNISSSDSLSLSVFYFFLFTSLYLSVSLCYYASASGLESTVLYDNCWPGQPHCCWPGLPCYALFFCFGRGCHLFAVCIQRADEWPLEVSTTLYEITLSMRQLHNELSDAISESDTIKWTAQTTATHPCPCNLCASCIAASSVDRTALSTGANLWPTNKRQLPVNI